MFSDLQIIYNFFFNSKNHAFLKFMFYHLQFSVQKYEFSWMKSHQAMFFIIFWHDTYILMAGRTNLVLFSILYKFSKNDAFYAKMSIFGFIFLHEIFFENFILYFSLITWVQACWHFGPPTHLISDHTILFIGSFCFENELFSKINLELRGQKWGQRSKTVNLKKWFNIVV